MAGDSPAARAATGGATAGGGNLILYLASANAGKLRELERRLGPAVELRPPPPGFRFPEETGETYEANARLKARALRDATGAPALADDSGLEVDALGGAPGVRSARYGRNDRERIDRLLAALAGVAAAGRSARFRCVLVVSFPNGREIVAEGACEGTVTEAPRGEGGFGYDPVFVPEGEARTFAELAPGEKDARSHRGRAIRRLATRLAEAP